MMLSKKLIIFLGFLFLISCATGRKNSFNYYDPKFKCVSNTDYRDRDWLTKLYFPLWNDFKQKYNIENSQLTNKADVVLVGNSLVHLFPSEIITKEFPKASIALRGIGGEVTDLTILRLKENVLSLNPKIIVLEIGGNDLIQGKCLSYIENNISKIIKIIHEDDPETLIILTSIPPTGNSDLNSISPLLNVFLMTQSQKQKKVYFIDLWSEMRENDRPTIKFEYTRPKDKIHFNNDGYVLWTKLLKPFISKL